MIGKFLKQNVYSKGFELGTVRVCKWSQDRKWSRPNHTANDMLSIPIEKIFSNRDSIRKAREAFLIQTGKTIDPDGLKIREETY